MTPTPEDFLSGLEPGARKALQAGLADPGVRLLVDTLHAMRPRGVDLADMSGGAMLEAVSPVAMAPDALTAVMARIDALPGDAASVTAARQAGAALDELVSLPIPLRDTVLDAAGGQGWKFAGPGIRVIDLDLGGQTEVQVMRIQAGAGVPRHTHGGREYTLCLSGGFSDGRGSYGPGDLSIADPDVTHQPHADADGACIVLAVTDQGLKFTGLLGMVQRLFGG